MPNDLAFFAIHADDCDRAMAFYSDVFGWTFQPWGPPGFWLIQTSADAIRGALHQRQHEVVGQGMIGFECTIAVQNIQSTVNAIQKAGGKLLHAPYVIDGVGTVVRFEDTERNQVCAMQYEPGALQS